MKYLLLLIALSGCTTSYKHLSNTAVSDDGYDLICGGVEYDRQLRVSGNICHNIAAYKGEYVLIDVTYRWMK